MFTPTIRTLEKNKFNFIKYKFYFKSLIAPTNCINLTLDSYNTNLNIKKLIIKQSYMILTWFYYIKVYSKTNNKNFKFFILPKKKTFFTITKAPIAHKTRSKEQIKFETYSIIISFNSRLIDMRKLDLNQSLLFVLIAKTKFPNYESNLLFLKNLELLFFCKPITYYNFKY